MTVPSPVEANDAPSELFAEVRRGLDMIETVVTDPRLQAAMQELDDGAVRQGAVGAAFRQYLTQHGIALPNELAVHLTAPTDPSQDWGFPSGPHHSSFCFDVWHSDRHGVSHPIHVGVHHDSSGWHWGC